MSSSTFPTGRLLDGVINGVLDTAVAAVPADALGSSGRLAAGVAGAAPPAGAADVSGVAALLARRVRADAVRPLLTFYDDATGERSELSAATVDNWVSKTANLLVDTLGIAAGDTVRIVLPPHWQTAVVLLAAWSAGARVAVQRPDVDTGPDAVSGTDDHDDPPVAVFVTEDAVDDPIAVGDGAEIVALSLRPMGGRLAQPVPGVLDFAGEVLSHGDRFTAPVPPANQRTLTRLATYYAQAWDLTEQDRILTTAGYDTPDGLLGGLLSPLAAGASVVLCRHLDRGLLDRRIAVERVTAVCGPAASGPAASGPAEPGPILGQAPTGVRRLGTVSL
ncbi:TIGR03089 family protein [Candidatus Protofrankia californiensis]|uniref:TIGR03089 family protein n=1 Tax=Candidatus Protofrankia californiensis TaxID=1839754 RepID=UPI001040E569|nr:TIGR03089 family protein [Candidatus Protofrankia californiensis]